MRANLRRRPPLRLPYIRTAMTIITYAHRPKRARQPGEGA